MGCVPCNPTSRPIVVTKEKGDKESCNKSDYTQRSDSRIKTVEKTQETILIKKHLMMKKIDIAKVNDNYKILNKLGKGAFGSVYKVLHIHSNKFRAMKVIKKETLLLQDDDKSFLREIELLKQTDHPNIIRVFEYYQDDVNYYIITEFVSGGELYDTIASWKNFNEDKAGYIIYQILCAVNYLHTALHIVHRDIKPENILVEKNVNKANSNPDRLNIKIIDFGTGNFFDNEKKLSLRVGTPYYIAPEVLGKNYKEKVDIWSCGVILYILLVGYPPFAGSNTQEILGAVKLGKYEMSSPEWSKINKNAKDLVKKMLEYNPDKRISAKEALAHPFFSKISKLINTVAEPELSSVLRNIRHFNAKEKFQQATLAYIVHFFISSSEIEVMSNAFRSLDKDNDGRLNYDELKQGFEKACGKHISDEEILNIMSWIDQDENGFIEYQEFLRGAMNRKKIISEENLKLAFHKFDLNNDGKLSINEIKEVFGTEDSQLISQLIAMIDKNNDGEVSYSEFCEAMEKLVYNTMGETLLYSPRSPELINKKKERENNNIGIGNFIGNGIGNGVKENINITPIINLIQIKTNQNSP
jgi:calcium-dependent protein kinase